MFRIKTIAMLLLVAAFVLGACVPAAPVAEAPVAEAAGCRGPSLPIAGSRRRTASTRIWSLDSCRPALRAAGARPTPPPSRRPPSSRALSRSSTTPRTTWPIRWQGFKQFIEDPEVNVIVLSALETTGWEACRGGR